MEERTLRVLEFNSIRDMLKTQAVCTETRERLGALLPVDNIYEARALLKLSSEAESLLIKKLRRIVVHLIEGGRGYLQINAAKSVEYIVAAKERNVFAAEDDVGVLLIYIKKDADDVGMLLAYRCHKLVGAGKSLAVDNDGEEDLAA